MKNEKNEGENEYHPSASKDWLLTVKVADYSLDDVKEALKNYRWVGQKEKGEEATEKNPGGYIHWQIAIINDTPVRFDTLRHKLYGSHFKAGFSRQDLFNYATKDKTRLEGPYENGDWTNRKEILAKGSKKGQRTDLESVRTAIMDDGLSFNDLMSDPVLSKTMAHSMQWARELVNTRDSAYYSNTRCSRHSMWIWGTAGIGKTTYVEKTCGLENLYEITDYKNPFDNYQGQPIIFLDEFNGKLDYQLLLKLMDDSPVLLPARYSNLWAKHIMIIIASNHSPREIYPDVDGEERIALYRRLDSIMELCNYDEIPIAWEPKSYFMHEKETDSNEFRAFLGCYDPKHFTIDYETFRNLNEDFSFPIEDFSRIIDYDSTVNQDLPYKRSEDEDLDFDVF